MSVFLRSNAFIGLVASAAEGFKSEVVGLLFGDFYPEQEKYLIETAIPLQAADRTPNKVHFNRRRTNRVKALWDGLSPLWYLGEYHSHPEYGGVKYYPVLSESDKRTMEPGMIEVIVSIWKAKRKDVLGYIKEDMRISGAVGDYFVQVSAWKKTEDGDTLEQELWCPYINIINESREMGVVPQWGCLFEGSSIVSRESVRTLREQVVRYEDLIFQNPKNNGTCLAEVRKTLRQLAKELQ